MPKTLRIIWDDEMIKYILIVISLLSISTNNIYSQEIDNEIKSIRSNYLMINKELNSYKKIEYIDVLLYKDMNPVRYSMEGARLDSVVIINCYKYFENDTVRKIVVTFDCPYDFQTSEYYVRNNKLFFVFKTRIHYLKPRWADNFIEKDRIIIENQYYIKDNKLIRWLDENKKLVLDTGKIKSEEETLIHDYRSYLNINQADIGPAGRSK